MITPQKNTFVRRGLMSIAAISMLISATEARAASGPLLEVAPLALTVTAGASGSLDIEAAPGKSLMDCRPYLASRAVGAGTWQEETSAYKVVSQAPGKLVLEAPFTHFKATVTLQRDAAGRQEFSGRLDSTTDQPMELARFHYLDGIVTDPSMNLLSMRQFELPGRIVKPSEKLVSPNSACRKGWGSVYWPRLAEPVHDQPDVAISGDTGMLAVDWNTPGFFLGFTGPGSAFGELGIRTSREKTPFFAAVLLDAVRVAPRGSRVLEGCVLSFGDPQDELRNWAVSCRDVLGPPRVKAPLVGYCSWYQEGQDVQPSDIRRAIRTFESFVTPPGGRTIQIDDGFQVGPGDWSGRGEWKDGLQVLCREIADKGFIPGIWVAPTAIHASHPIVKEHPEWLQRDAKGDPCIRFHNWKNFNGMKDAETYFLEPDHPDARRFILEMLRKLRADGWKYFKFDFAYTVSSDRVKYDPQKTTYESLREQWRLFREAVGEDAIVNSCVGGMWRYTVGAVDVSRIGGDIGGSMPTLRRNLSEMMLRSHVNGLWFQADPDVYYMRGVDSSLNFAQSHLLTATQGLLGTAFLTSDFGDQWSAPAEDVVRRYWNKSGPRVPLRQHIILKPDGLPAALIVAHGDGDYEVALYNWDPQPADVSIPLKDLRLPDGVAYSAVQAHGDPEKTTLKEGVLCVSQQPGESMRVIRIRASWGEGQHHQR